MPPGSVNRQLLQMEEVAMLDADHYAGTLED